MAVRNALVRCPRCDQRVTATPEVKTITYERGRLTVTFEPSTPQHHCGQAPAPVGFAPRKEGT